MVWRSQPRYLPAPMRAPILALKGVRLADGPLMLFDGVDLALEARTRACLVGRNGAGKSTLLRILAGEILPDDGERTVTPGTRIESASERASRDSASGMTDSAAGSTATGAGAAGTSGRRATQRPSAR